MHQAKRPESIIYQAPNWAIELRGDFDKETVWANRMQMAEMFWVNPQAISKHIQNIYTDNELQKETTSSKMELVQNESGRIVTRQVDYYNLDVIIAVWYRINSVIGTKFRQRATQTLKQHITQWYTINKHLLEKHYTLFQQALSDIQQISHNQLSSDDILELVKSFSYTWFSLDAFDTGRLEVEHQTQQSIHLQANDLYQDIQTLKHELMTKGEASDLFAQEKHTGSLEGIFWNVFQTAFGEYVYPSIESKASHLLYFIIKNHPFNDGNKRTGAFAFIWLLQKCRYWFRDRITPEALVAITLMIAISDNKEKQRMIDIVMLLLRGNKDA